MANNDFKKKLEKVLTERPVSQIERARWRRENRDWLEKSSRIAVSVLLAIKEYGWSQKQLAERMEVSPQQVNKIVKGQENLTLSTISKLENVLGISLIEISDYAIQSEQMTSDYYHQSIDLDIDLWIQSLHKIQVKKKSPEYFQTQVEEVITDYTKSEKDKNSAKQTSTEIAGENNYALAA